MKADATFAHTMNSPDPQLDPQNDAPAAPAGESAMLRGLVYLLRPLVRLMLARGITYPTLSELLKHVYFKVATERFALPGKRLTDSRVSLITGLHRKDVKRLGEEPEAALETPRMVNWGSRLVSLWQARPDYRTEEGIPRSLMRLAKDGGELSFESLAAQVTRDIGHKAILDELLRGGVVRVDEYDRVHLETAAFLPRNDAQTKMHYFTHNLHDHLAAATHNLLDQEPPMLERSVHYAGLSQESVQTLERLAEAHGMKTLLAINEAALALQELDKSKGGEHRHRMRFGVFFLRQPPE